MSSYLNTQFWLVIHKVKYTVTKPTCGYLEIFFNTAKFSKLIINMESLLQNYETNSKLILLVLYYTLTFFFIKKVMNMAWAEACSTQ